VDEVGTGRGQVGAMCGVGVAGIALVQKDYASLRFAIPQASVFPEDYLSPTVKKD